MTSTRLTGEQLEEIKQQAADHFWPHARQAGNVAEDTGLKVVTGGQGVWVNDSAGEPWFDLIAGMFLKNIGHGRKEIADAVYEQMQGISYTPGGDGGSGDGAAGGEGGGTGAGQGFAGLFRERRLGGGGDGAEDG